MRDLVRDNLAELFDGDPDDAVTDRAVRVVAAEVHRLYAVVLDVRRLEALARDLAASSWEVVRDLEAEFPWSRGLPDRIVRDAAGLVAGERPADVDAVRVPSLLRPTVALDKARALARKHVAGWADTGSGPPWLEELRVTDAVAAALVVDRVLAETGVRLGWVVARAGDDGPTESTERCGVAAPDVVASVLVDSGGADRLTGWATHMVSVDRSVIDSATLHRTRPWHSGGGVVTRASGRLASGRFSLDDAFLARSGLGSLATRERTPLLQAFYGELELRVGTALSKDLTDAELEEFEHVIDAGDEQASSVWLEQHRPDYPQTVSQVLASLGEELASHAEVVLDLLGRDEGGLR
ncbi:DUF5663 domain-containing protein [Nocardioides sp. WV_118_6]